MSGTLYTWSTAANGDWTTPADWSAAGFPDGASVKAVLGDTGAYYSVSLGGTDPLITLGSLLISSSGAELDIAATGGIERVLGNVTNNGALTLDDVFDGAGGSTLAIGGTLVNVGGAYIGSVGLAASTTLAVGALANTGLLYVTAIGGAPSDTASILVSGAAGFGTAGTLTGQVDLDGAGTIAFAGGGQIGTIAPGAVLLMENGASMIDAGGTGNSALAGLSINAGKLSLGDDTLALTGDFANVAQIDIDDLYAGVGGSVLDVAGTLTNGGAIVIGGANLGAPATVSAGGLDNTLSIALAGSSATAMAMLQVTGPVANSGAITLGGFAGATLDGIVSGTGSIVIEADATLAVGTLAQGVSFAGGGATLTLEAPAAATGTIAGFAIGDTLDLLGIHATGATASNGVLSVTRDGAGPLDFALPGGFAGDVFRTDDHGSYSSVSESVACYCSGTMIATPCGERPIEALAIGDAVLTASGRTRKIRWIGRRSYDRRFLRRNDAAWPILFRAGALADAVPTRDLLVSPHHAMLVDGVLVAAGLLVNGGSIRRADPTGHVDYLHVELATHDVLLANGAPSESFVDDNSRGLFHNACEHAALYPDARRVLARFCAPRLEDGARVAAIRLRLAARGAAAAVTHAPPAPLLGHLDLATRRQVAGWAMDPADPERPVTIEVHANGRLLSQAVANADRPDVRRAGYGSGFCGFDVVLPKTLSALERQVIEVCRADDGARLGAAVTIEAADRFGGALEQAVGAAVTALDDTAGRGRALAFLLGEVERLRQHQADADAGRSARAAAIRHRRRGEPIQAARQRALVIDASPPGTATAEDRRRRAGNAALAGLGYEVSLAAVEPAIGARVPRGMVLCTAPVYAGIEDVLRRQAGCLDLVYLHGAELALRYLALARGYQPHARLVLDLGHLRHRRLAAQAARENRPALLAASRRLLAQECLAARGADLVLLTTGADVAALRAALPDVRTILAPWPSTGTARVAGLRAALAPIADDAVA